MNKIILSFAFLLMLGWVACKGDNSSELPSDQDVPSSFDFKTLEVNGEYNGFEYKNLNLKPTVKISFEAPVRKETIEQNITYESDAGNSISYVVNYSHQDSMITIQPKNDLEAITLYTLNISDGLESQQGGTLASSITLHLETAIDSTDKFPRISDSALLTLIEKQTFKYFWDFGHPVSGMARERNTSGDVCTTGGTGFGVMAILVGIHRGFITRTEGLNRLTKMVDFYKNKCTAYHGAFAHWINGSSGETIPFSDNDDGADLVETSFLMEGLLTARQFFNKNTTAEKNLRVEINDLWNDIDWNWFQKNGENTLYWHWSPDKDWAMNMPIKGWNEGLMVYVLAASSNTHAITKQVYDNGWAQNGTMKNGNTFFGIYLPLGPDLGGPLFFAHYSFLGLNPHGLSDQYADYWKQNTAQAKINYSYCVNNPKDFNGYSEDCWGLTAGDDNNGYDAHSPSNDDGVISPTGAVSSIPYTPQKSLKAIRFFYYKLGNKIWGKYGFKDGFNLNDIWFADSYLAIDQGPQIAMIENYRSGMLWDLFMSCPEIQQGLDQLGFTYSK